MNRSTTMPGVVVLAAAVGFAAVHVSAVRAQSAAREKAPAFDAASVKPNHSGQPRLQAILFQPGGRFVATNASLRELVGAAYGEAIPLPDFQIVGGAKWMDTERFDVVAKAEGDPLPGAKGPPPLMFAMLRSLLAERFKLTVHNETRDQPIYALIVARGDGKLGPAIHPTTSECGPARRAALANGPPPPGTRLPSCGTRGGPGQLVVTGMQLADFAGWSLSRIVNRVVVDRTALTELYDWKLEWTPDVPQPAPGARSEPLLLNGVPVDPNGPSIFTALQEQLGLKLESTRGPVDVLVIDGAARPTED